MRTLPTIRHPSNLVVVVVSAILLFALSAVGKSESKVEPPLLERYREYRTKVDYSGRKTYEESKQGFLLFLEQEIGQRGFTEKRFLEFEEALSNDSLTSSQIVLLRRWTRGDGYDTGIAFRLLAEFRIVEGVEDYPYQDGISLVVALCELAEAGLRVDKTEINLRLTKYLDSASTGSIRLGDTELSAIYRTVGRASYILDSRISNALLRQLLLANLNLGDAPWREGLRPPAQSNAKHTRSRFLAHMSKDRPEALRATLVEVMNGFLPTLDSIPGNSPPARDRNAPSQLPEMIPFLEDSVQAFRSLQGITASPDDADLLEQIAYELSIAEAKYRRQGEALAADDTAGRTINAWRLDQVARALEVLGGALSTAVPPADSQSQ